MKRLVRDYEAEEKAYKEQEQRMAECMAKPFPHNVPDFIPFVSISCYKVVDEETSDAPSGQ